MDRTDEDRRWQLGWNLMLLAVGLGVLSLALIFSPGEGEHVLFRGQPWGQACSFREVTGYPCSTCGMTRSWVWGIRGHIWKALTYSPAGFTLMAWMLTGGLLGGARLLSRRPTLWRLHWKVLVGWVLFWMVCLYLGGWMLRLGGINPLPL